MSEWTPPPGTGSTAPEEGAGVYLVVSRPDGLTTSWEGTEPAPALRTIIAEQASALGTRVLPGGHQRFGCAFLRLTVRPVPPGHEVTSSTSFSFGYETGSGGAPPDHPRVPAQALFQHAASHVERN